MNLSPAVARGGTRLTFDAVAAITDTVEQYHAAIAGRSMPWSPLQVGSGRTRGIVTPLVYRAIRGVNAALREGVDGVFGIVPGSAGPLRTEAEIRLVAALNGVLGDHLEESGNALAIPMTLVHDGRPLSPSRGELAAALPAASGHIAVLVHGLALSELSWWRGGAVPLGVRLEEALEITPLYLRYNTGRHISSNGRELAGLLERLCRAWPVPVQSLSLIGHSMGGLVIRSAGWYARQQRAAWTDRLSRVAFLGTPHHGAPLERAGQAFDVAVRQLPYVAPLALGRLRSAGIKDLSHGDLLDEDWRDHPPDEIRRDRRRPVPLLPHVDYYFAAATLGRGERDPLGRLLGDLLVQTHSAVGEHRHRARRLEVDPAKCRVFVERHHFDLLTDEEVHRQVIEWFA